MPSFHTNQLPEPHFPMSTARCSGSQAGVRRLSERGIAVTEMALLVPLLLLLAIGVAEFGRVFYTAITLSHAARAGVQYGAQNNAKSGDFSGMVKAAQDEAKDLGLGVISASGERFCRCPDGTVVNCLTGTCAGIGAPEIYVRVTTQTTFTTLASYPGVPSSVALTRVAVLRAQ
jgi:Flp pilus assembly protein TadG